MEINEYFIIKLTKSETLAMSIIELISLLHSMNVKRRFLLVTTVTGPFIFVNFCRVKFLIKPCIKVDFPTFGGPTIPTTMGAGSNDVLSTSGNCILFDFIS
jgi:hypothetical protein